MIGLFLTFRKLTAMLCHVCSFLFHSGVAECQVPRNYRSCLLPQDNISRLTLCLVRIELKLRRFRKPTFIDLKSGASCKYFKSISRVFHKPVFIGLNCRCGLHLRPKELLHYCCHQPPAWEQQSNNTGQGSAVTTILSKPRIIFHVCEGDFGI